MATRTQQRRGTAAQWAAANPVLADGEIGYEKDTGIVKVGNGTSTWNQLSPIMGSQFLPVLGKANDSERLDGLDSSAFARQDEFESYAKVFGGSRTYVNHWGTATSFPTTNLRVGDRVWRTDLFCEFYFNGGSWRQVVNARGTAAQRNAIASTNDGLYQGFQWFETDSGNIYEWQNSFLRWTQPWGQAWGEMGSLSLTNPQNTTAAYVNYASLVILLPKARKLRIKGISTWYTASTTLTTIRTRLLVYRDTATTPSTVALTGTDIDMHTGGSTTADLSKFVYDTPYVTSGVAGGTNGWVNTRFVLQAMYTTAPQSALYTTGGSEQNFISVVDMGPNSSPPIG